jgi:RHS repeat-associated protein
VSVTVNGVSSEVVYGAGRAFTASGGTATGFSVSVLGDAVGGSLTVSSGFDPYGIPDSQTVGVGFGYRGELHIGSLVYLRARDYDPVLGRFLTPDPLSGVPGTTTVTNPYPYGNNDPVGRVDPTGLRAEDSEMAAAGDRQLPNRLTDPLRRAIELNTGRMAFDAFEGLGLLEVAAFIRQKVSSFFGIPLYKGDGRGFAAGSLEPLSSRFFLRLDFATGKTQVRMQETCGADGDPCWPPLPVRFRALEHSQPELFFASLANFFYVLQDPAADVLTVGWLVLHGDTSGKAPFTRLPFDGRITVRSLAENALEVSYRGDCFPSVEAHIVPGDGRRIVVLQFQDLGPFRGFAFTGDCTVYSSGTISR